MKLDVDDIDAMELDEKELTKAAVKGRRLLKRIVGDGAGQIDELDDLRVAVELQELGYGWQDGDWTLKTVCSPKRRALMEVNALCSGCEKGDHKWHELFFTSYGQRWKCACICCRNDRDDGAEDDMIPFVECANFEKCQNIVLFLIEHFCDDCLRELDEEEKQQLSAVNKNAKG